MITSLVEKVKKALKSENCSYCQFQKTSGTLVCPDCENKLGLRDTLPMGQRGGFELYAATLFNPRIKRLLYPYKFYNRQEYAETLSDILIDYWRRVEHPEMNARNTVVVPVPSRWKHNPLGPIARRFASDFGFSFNENLLCWERDTLPQHKLTGKRRRWQNVEGSMGVDGMAWDKCLNPGRSGPTMVLVIDDMTTTGATLYEARQAFERFPAFEGKVVTLALSHVPLALHRQVN